MPFHAEYKNSKGNAVDVHVLVFTRPNLRDDDMFTHIGFGVLENLFDLGKVDFGTTSITLMYPERWTNILEQRAIMDRIFVLYPNIEKLRITTHSVYIIQCTHNGCIGICDTASDYPEKDYKNPDVRYCPVRKGNTGFSVFSL